MLPDVKGVVCNLGVALSIHEWRAEPCSRLHIRERAAHQLTIHHTPVYDSTFKQLNQQDDWCDMRDRRSFLLLR